MPATLTLKNVPDDVVERLKLAALANRRSMYSEAIVLLEAALVPAKMAPSDRLARARELRASLSRARFLVRDIDKLKREGRA
jgi:antitoxin FitA